MLLCGMACMTVSYSVCSAWNKCRPVEWRMDTKKTSRLCAHNPTVAKSAKSQILMPMPRGKTRIEYDRRGPQRGRGGRSSRNMLSTTVSGVSEAFIGFLATATVRYSWPPAIYLESHTCRANWRGAAAGNVQGPANQGDSFKMSPLPPP
jgi:hypothetical protein